VWNSSYKYNKNNRKKYGKKQKKELISQIFLSMKNHHKAILP
jgi:hypothetical protein